MTAPLLTMPSTSNAYTDALANQINRQAVLMEQPYVADTELLKQKEDDASDFDMTKNDIEASLIAPINTTNPFRYINTTAGTWHPYHDANVSKQEIWESLLLATNKAAGTGSNPKDLEILRRVIKQAPIMLAYNHLFWSTLITIIGIIVIIYFTVQGTMRWGYGAAFGVFSFIILGTAAYNIIWGGKADGKIKWMDVKNDIVRVSNENGSIRAVMNILNGKKPDGSSINPPAPQAAQQSMGSAAVAGVAAGVANAAVGALASGIKSAFN